MLDTDPPEYGVEMVRDIAGRIDVSGAGPAQFVDKNAVGLLDRRRNGRHIRINPDATDGEVARDTIAAGRPDRLQPLGALERRHLVPSQQLDAVRAVDGADHCADLLAQDLLQGNSPGKDGGNANPELCQGGRHLATNEAHADYYRAPIRHSLALDRVAVDHRAQVMDPGQPSPGKLKPPGSASSGYQDLLIRQLPA